MKKILLFTSLFLFTLVGALSAQTPPNPDISETVFTSTKVTLSATADGTTPITFTWFKNGVQVSTGTSLVFNSIQTSDAGTYKVTATNSVGSADSNNATLIVIVPVAPSNVKITITKG
jgi:membrane carboxypeptidase/penicillin-binding protein PbpC